MPRVLIVEDSATQAERLAVILETEGYEVAVARNGKEALRLLAEQPVDVIVSDILMPGMSGYDFCRKVKTAPATASIPVILLSTLNEPMDIIRGLECGADNFLTKPYDPEHLMRRLRALLESKRIRTPGRLSFGIDVVFLGKKFTITAEKEQIVDLLMSTFEDTVRANRELESGRAKLAEAKIELERYAATLEERVKERTAELSRLNEALQAEITTRAAAEAELRRTRAFLDAVVENVPGVLFVKNAADGRFVLLNRAGEELLGIPREKFIGKTAHEIFPLDEANRFAAHDQEVLSAGTLQTMPEEPVSTRHRGVRLLRTKKMPITDEQGRPRYLLGLSEDITEAKEQEASFQLLFDGNPVPMWVYDVETLRFCAVNEAAVSRYGYTREQFLSMPLLDIRPPEDRNAPPDPAAPWLVQGETDTVWRHLTADGRRLEVEIFARPLVYQGRSARLIAAIDVTERRRAEAELREAERKLHHAQKMEALGQLTGGLAHDFNNLLGIIVGNLDILKERLRGGGDTEELIDESLQAALRGADLNRRLLAFARRQPLQPKVVDVNELLTNIGNLLRRTIGEQIELTVSTTRDLWPVRIDPSQLEACITNLAVNARDAMPKGGSLAIQTRNVSLTANDEKQLELAAGDYVIVEVQDTGVGIPGELLNRVFEPFFTTKAAGKGTGLGLSQVFGFVKQSGGHVKLESEVGRGTTVRLYLPRATGVDAKDVVETGGGSLQTSRGEMVLVVEDNAQMRRLLLRQLRELGYRAVEAEDPHSALRLLRAQRFDLLLTDIVMPGGMSGWDLAGEALQLHTDLKVMFISGFPDLGNDSDGQVPAGCILLTKPFRKESLAEKLRQALDS